MDDTFSFNLNAMRARDEINDAVSQPRSPRLGQMQPVPTDPSLMQQLSQRVNVQGDRQMQQLNVNAPLGGGFNANLGVSRMGAGPNMPSMGPQVTNVGVGYNSPKFSAGVGVNPAQRGVNAGFSMPFKKGGMVSGGDFAVKREEYASGGGAWTRKEGQNPEGGLNAKGRASLKAQGQDIKPPVSAKQAAKSPKAAARRKSFCARSAGQAKMFPEAARDPDSRLNKARRKWDCKAQGGIVEGYAEGGESRVNEAGNYTKPTMRKGLFNSIKAGGKGGAPGQWSARKAQMLAQQYKAKGGGYRD